MKLIVGLGNPGVKYEKTPHNAGFEAVKSIALAFDIKEDQFALKKKLKSQLACAQTDKEKIILAMPQTFMNESGKAVQALLKYYNLEKEDLTVIHDDSDIEAGKIKTAQDSRSAGHKGVQSIIDSLGTKTFTRIRIGIKPAQSAKMDLAKFVLKKTSKEDRLKIRQGIALAAEEVIKRK